MRINMNNLTAIPCIPQILNNQRRPLKFTLLNARSIGSKTLLINDYIGEHDIDLLAITETWLHEGISDDFYCRDICAEGYRTEQIPRTYIQSGGVATVYKKCFKAKHSEL